MADMFVLGLCGVTNSGKSTLSKELLKHFDDTKVVSQDDYFLPEEHPNHVFVPTVSHLNWEILSALDMPKMIRDVKRIIERKECKLLIIEGFTFLLQKELRDLCDCKIYLALPLRECRRRRKSRTYTPPDPPGYFEIVVWPESIKARERMLKEIPDIFLLDGSRTISALREELISIIKDCRSLKKIKKENDD